MKYLSWLLAASLLAFTACDSTTTEDSGTPPAPDTGTTTPPSDSGTTTPPADSGTTTPPADSGTTMPPADSGTTPPVDSGTTPPTDAGTTTPAAHCGGSDLIITSINTTTNEITVFNPTDASINTTGYQFCANFTYDAAEATIAAGESHTFTWAGFPSSASSGELGLYRNGSFGSLSAMVDYTCWGSFSGGRKSVAERTSGTTRWAGACAGAITGSELRRIPDTDGTSASSYDTAGAAASLSCP